MITFLLQIDNNLKFVQTQPNIALVYKHNWGPIFGNIESFPSTSCDLAIGDKANAKKNSYSSVSSAFSPTKSDIGYGGVP